jgi:two-component system, chemotaxis family, protein-glutamate methylesterase/glutaminase
MGAAMHEAQTRHTVVIAASAGGVEALRDLLSRLPPTLPAAVLVVLHVPAAGGRALPRILERAGRLPAVTAADGEAVLPGHVYVAPPDCHLLLVAGRAHISHGPRHNGHRPAADPLFISAAAASGPGVIAVVLSGTLDDGAAGCAAVERRGGLVLVQDPAESAYDGMPRAAIAATRHPRVLRLAGLATAIDQEARMPVSAAVAADPDLERQLSMFLGPDPPDPAAPSGWSGVSCPECGGPLRQQDTATPVRFHCPAGHTWSPESLVADQAGGIEQALWAAVLRLEERARLNEALAGTASTQGYPASAGGFLAAARSAQSSARQIRRLLTTAGLADIPSPAAASSPAPTPPAEAPPPAPPPPPEAPPPAPARP